MSFAGAGHLLHRNHAAREFLAANMLELHGRVTDMKMIAQHVIEFHQNTSALRGGDVGDRHVTGQRARMRSEAPYMQIVNIYNTLHRLHAGPNLAQRDSARRALEQDVEGLANNAVAGP